MKTKTFLLFPAIILFLTAGLTAQYSHSWVTPRGAAFEEGHAASAVQFGFNNANYESRTQQIDKGFQSYPVPMIIKGIGWRRDGRARASSIKRTGELEVLMSHADFAKVTNVYANNYKGLPLTVFTKKVVNLPDWTAAPPCVPASFDLVLPLDKIFVYHPKDALLFELIVRNLSSTQTYHMDFYRNNQLNYGFGEWPTLLGGGSTTKNGEMVQSCCVRAGGSGLELNFRLWGAPSSTQVYAILGNRDPNLTLPGMGAFLHANLLSIIPVGMSQANGKVPPTKVASTGWSPLFSGAVFYTQCYALDLSLPWGIALSSAQRCPAPVTNIKSNLPLHMIWNYSSSTATSGYLDSLTCCPTIFTY